MDPVRSSLVGGVAGTAVLSAVLALADVALGGTGVFVSATFTSLCAVGGPPYCQLASPTATALTLVWYLALYAVAWPLLFAGFTWGLPGESGPAHGAAFGLVLWVGFLVVVVFDVVRAGASVTGGLVVLVAALVAYLAYGLVLGGVYDRLAAHRTFLTPETGEEPAA